MVKNALFVLFLLPGLAHAAICKTVGEDGVVSFTNVPTIDCPEGSQVPDYSRPAPEAEQANRVDSGITGRQIPFERYRSIEIVSPEADGLVRSNDGNVRVSVKLDPGLQQGHFITVYLDGRTIRGAFGSSQIELSNVDRGRHDLHANVSDASGRVWIESKKIGFTLQRIQLEPKVTVDRVTGDDFISAEEAGRWVRVTGKVDLSQISGKFKVTILFNGSNKTYWAKVFPDGRWVAKVPGDLLAAEGSFVAVAEVFKRTAAGPTEFVAVAEYRAVKGVSVDPEARRRPYQPRYSPEKPDYAPTGEGIPTAPRGETNPAFTAPQGGIPTTPGRTNPAYTP